MWSELAPFVAACLAIELTPGPNMAYLAVLSAQRGRLAGLLATCGVALGLLAIGLLSAFGFGQLVQDTPALYQALRWAGVAYLVWLAWESWRDARKQDLALPPLSSAFRRGLITNLLNPKAFLFYITVLPGFAPGGPDGAAERLVLTLVYVGVATLVHAAIALGAGGLTGLFTQARWRRRIGAGSAVVLLAIAMWLALKT